MTVLLYHNSLWNFIKDCLVNDNLMPYSTGSDCHPDDIGYALVKATIGMSDLDPSWKPSFSV
eukprot:5225311-Ditylum_brightwellii.AAC.1